MSYSNDYSYFYSSNDDSFSYISDLSTSYYCPVHYSPLPPPSNVCPIHQSYPFYFQINTPQKVQVSNSTSSSSLFQAHPRKKPNRRFTEDQIRILEQHFDKVDKYLSKETIADLSTRTQLKSSQIRVWFNNKRTRQHR